MQKEIYLILSAALVGIGVGSALARSNMISVILAVTTAGAGALIAMCTLDRQTGTDGMLFALCLGAVLLILMILGCALAYRRYLASGSTDISDSNELRH